MPVKVWGEITYPFLNFNGWTSESMPFISKPTISMVKWCWDEMSLAITLKTSHRKRLIIEYIIGLYCIWWPAFWKILFLFLEEFFIKTSHQYQHLCRYRCEVLTKFYSIYVNKDIHFTAEILPRWRLLEMYMSNNHLKPYHRIAGSPTVSWGSDLVPARPGGKR